jgi:N-acetylmuramoyl-L-alanine amidase
MPSCLIELGFISTPDEERFLHSASGVEQLGRGIYQAFVDYRNKYDKNIRVPYKAEPVQEKVDIPTVVPEKAQPAPVVAPKKEEPAPVVVRQDTVKTIVETPQPAAPVVQQDTAKASAPAQVQVSAPVFKLQILASSTRLKATDARLKGESSATYYEEGGLYKYTVGASEDYNEVSRLRKTLQEKFPQAFIIAFKDGKKMDVREAIREFKNRRNK